MWKKHIVWHQTIYRGTVKMSNIGNIWQIMFSQEEEMEIMTFLRENDYGPDRNGLKDFIFDCMEGEEEEKKVPAKEKLANFIKENPEVVAGLGNTLGLTVNFLKKKIGI